MDHSYTREKASGLSKLISEKKAKIGETYTTESVIDGSSLSYRLVKIASDDVISKTFPSIFNHRASDFLSISAVNDILPTIREHLRNSKSAIGVKSGDKIEILEGLRRRFAVSCVPGAQYHILVFDSMVEAEKSIRCVVSDIYTAPSVIDLGIKIKNYLDNYNETNEVPITTTELSKVFFVSRGKVSEAKQFGGVISNFYKLFPSLHSIGYKYMRNVLSLCNLNSIELNVDFCNQFDPVAGDIEDIKLLDMQVKTLKEQILLSLQPAKSFQPFKTIFNAEQSYIAGTGVKLTKQKAIISIDYEKVPESIQFQILELLKH